MAVVAMRSRSTAQWATAAAALHEALPIADHPRLTEHAAMADEFLRVAGAPSQPWANRIAAIAVISQRRADAAPTAQRRIAYLDVAAAASGLLVLAEQLHGVLPDQDALAILAELRGYPRESALI